jgi:hypothetical protein
LVLREIEVVSSTTSRLAGVSAGCFLVQDTHVHTRW